MASPQRFCLSDGSGIGRDGTGQYHGSAGLAAGSYPVVVTVNGRASAAATIYVSGANPSITSVTPNTVPAGGHATPITVAGTNFGGGSTVVFKGPNGVSTNLSSSLVSAAQLAATIPAALLSTAGVASIGVANGLGTLTNKLPFAITAPGAQNQTITFDAIPNQLLGGSPFPIAARASSGLAVTFTANTPAVCKVASDIVMLLSVGTCSITVSQPGGANYFPATAVTQTFTVTQAKASGTFVSSNGSPFAEPSNPRAVATGDFNGDGIQDLAFANQSTNNVVVMLGNGTGGFAQAPNSPFSAGTAPFALVVGDFNGDGHLDIATANQGSNNVTVLLGNGAGGFTAAAGSPFSAGVSPDTLAVGDFNGDGIQDLAVPGFTTNNVAVLLGNGSGGFTTDPNGPFPVGTHPFAVAVGDFNGDGFDDIAATNYNGANVTVLLGNGSGGFTAAVGSPFAVGTDPTRSPWAISMATASPIL